MPRKSVVFIEALQNPLIAFLLCFVGMVIFGLIFPQYWVVLFSIICAYLISDIVINLVIRGGNGIATIPAINNQTKHKGHSYIAFFIGIIFSTLVSSVFSDLILRFVLMSPTEWIIIVLGSSLGLGVAVFADLQAKFYAHK